MTALDQAFRAAGAAAWGGVAYDRLTPEMTREDQEKVRAQCPQPRTVLVAAFPYYAGDRPGNLSLYARGEDYHRALARRLNTVCDFLSRQYPMESFLPAADNSPLPEREAARLAGLGKVGRHGLLILPPYGSFLFLGTILTGAGYNLARYLVEDRIEHTSAPLTVVENRHLWWVIPKAVAYDYVNPAYHGEMRSLDQAGASVNPLFYPADRGFFHKLRILKGQRRYVGWYASSMEKAK